MRAFLLTTLVLSLGLGTVSCGDDGSPGGGGGAGGGSSNPATRSLCERWVEAVCTGFARCEGEIIPYDECVDGYSCEDAIDADDDAVERCEEQLPEAECDSFTSALAGFCEGAVEFPDEGSGGGGSGGDGGGTGGGGLGGGAGGGGDGGAGEPVCDSSSECINDVCECTTEGKEGVPCSDPDSCVAECEVCVDP